MLCLADQIKKATQLTEQTKEEMQSDFEHVRTKISALTISQIAQKKEIDETKEQTDSYTDDMAEILYYICLLQLGLTDEDV